MFSGINNLSQSGDNVHFMLFYQSPKSINKIGIIIPELNKPKDCINIQSFFNAPVTIVRGH